MIQQQFHPTIMQLVKNFHFQTIRQYYEVYWFGTSKSNCLYCVQEFHRSIQRNQCLCQPGDYDDGINLPCLPICGDQIIVDEDDCDDGNNDPYDGCHQCQFTFQDECQICFKGKCYHCKDNYSLIEAINTFISICGDLVIIKMNNAMMVIILNLIDVILVNSNVKEFVRNGMKQMDGIQQVRNVNLYVEMEQLLKDKQYCEDSNLYPFDLCNFCEQECSEHCLLCSNGKCLKCGKGFQYDEQNKLCFQICSDILIVGNEQCLDQITYYLQICENCQLSVIIIFNYVIMANVINVNLVIIQLIMVVNKIMEMDKLQVLKFLTHLFNISILIDLTVIIIVDMAVLFAIRESVKMGYLLDNYACYPIYGDLIIVEPELCDDGNLIPFNGCHNYYSCDLGCIICQSGQCTEISKPNEDNNNDQTTSDLLLINQQFMCTYLWGQYCDGLEGYDDGNDQPQDGCYNCQFLCFQGCVECQQNQCTKCNDKFYIFDILTQKCLQINSYQNDQNIDYPTTEFQQYNALRCGENQLLINNLCINKCGNGFLANKYEECDDGNIFGGDGCSSFCNTEDSLNQEDSLSLCTYIEAPDFNLNILSDKGSSIQLLELTFTQQVKIQTGLVIKHIMLFTISPETQYYLTINSIDNKTIYLGYPKYQIQIEHIQPIQNPILKAEIEKSIIHNAFHYELQIYQKKIILGTTIVLPETTKQQQLLLYKLMILAQLSSNAIMFFNILDLLLSLPYIKFMQNKFLPNLIEFLNTYPKVSLQSIMNYFKVDQLLAKLNGGTFPNHFTNKSNNQIQAKS
ncbi:unnamed protein product [Paramecium pentaurelia]|uniref:Uncharacterized protein n=1 Tax=Paramecium pentaurelia TaxID=43138 RepID=A0A8S1XNG8_9CILI|nr:unnamed protein product [Paramecium pentaurelia]